MVFSIVNDPHGDSGRRSPEQYQRQRLANKGLHVNKYIPGKYLTVDF